jgi:hypothetical protein
MLSPNARNRVAISVGGRVTETVKPQDALRLCASLAVHVTPVIPRENVDPLPGVHVEVTGAAPPVTVGAG